MHIFTPAPHCFVNCSSIGSFEIRTCESSNFVLILFLFVFFILNYILLIRLLQLSWFFPLCPPSTHHPPLHQKMPPPLFMSMGRACKFFGFFISYLHLHVRGWSVPPCISSSPHLFTHSPHPPPTQQPSKCSPYPRFYLFVCLVCFFFLDSVVDRFVFNAILLFILLIFFC